MKVVLYTKWNPWGEWRGGGQQVVHCLAEALVALGHQARVVYTYQKAIPPVPALTYDIEWCWWGHKGMSLVTVPRSIVAAARTLGADIVFGHGEEMLTAPLWSRALGLPWVMGAQHPGFYPIGLWHDLKKGIRTLLDLYQLRMYVHHAALRRAPLVIVPSRFSARRIHEIVEVPLDRITVIPNGVEDSWFDVQRAEEPDRTDTLVYFGRFEVQKGVDVLIGAMPRILQARPGLRLRLFGGGEPFESEYRQLVTARGLDANVEFAGWQPRDVIREAVRRARLCILPSRYEALSLAILEAMAAGTPLVVAAIESVQDLISDGVEALTFESANSDALATRVLEALDDPRSAENCAVAARARAQDYRWSAVARRFVDTFTQQIEAFKRT